MNFAEVLGDALERCLKNDVISPGFKKTGICPFNVDAPFENSDMYAAMEGDPELDTTARPILQHATPSSSKEGNNDMDPLKGVANYMPKGVDASQVQKVMITAFVGPKESQTTISSTLTYGDTKRVIRYRVRVWVF